MTWILTDKESSEGNSVFVSYVEEGIYSFSIRAENESGSDDVSIL